MDNGNQKKSKIDVVSAASTAVGAAIGTVGGNLISAELNSQDENVEIVDATPQTIASDNADSIQPNIINITIESPNANVHTSEPIAASETGMQYEQHVVTESNQNENHEPNVEVLSCETVTNDDGSQMEVAHIYLDGNDTLVFDVDNDSIADVLAIDLNSNDELDDDEMADISGENIPMNIFHEEIMNNEFLAENRDYVNDADVTDYMA